MSKPVTTPLPKNTNSNQPNSEKLVIDCKQITTSQPTTETWLQVEKRLAASNYDDKNRVLLGYLVERKSSVVIKIGETTSLEKEYNIGTALKQYNIEGFIKYGCFFKCQDKYKEHPSNSRKHLCKGLPSDDPSKPKMSVLVMPYYRLGSLADFNSIVTDREDKTFILKDLLEQIIAAFANAFTTVGFIHNDSHARNILITKTKKTQSGYGIVIMDFENAMINVKTEDRRFVYKDFGRLIADLHYNHRFNLKGTLELLTLLMKLESSSEAFDNTIPQIIVAISQLSFDAPMITSPNQYVYNPNIL